MVVPADDASAPMPLDAGAVMHAGAVMNDGVFMHAGLDACFMLVQ